MPNATTTETKTRPATKDQAPLTVAKNFDAANYSAEHAEHIALMDHYFERVRAQETMYVGAGLPADGLADFLVKWFAAWEERSVVALRACMTSDMVYADPTTGSELWYATQTEFDLYNLIFKLVPDVVFYPQADTPNTLPYYDFLDGNVRMTVPWRMVGRARFTPRAVDRVGVDRYDLVDDPDRGWLISRIDTDGDTLGLLGQLAPFVKVKYPSQKAVQRLLRTAQRMLPSLRGPEVEAMTNEER